MLFWSTTMEAGVMSDANQGTHRWINGTPVARRVRKAMELT
jgi:hypothetical protein